MRDTRDKIDSRQFGNVKGVSTSHYLVDLVNFLSQGAENIHNVGTVVLTDFSKAFDLVDHYLLIDLGVRGSIVPWVGDFLNNRTRCVRFNNIKSDYLLLKGGIAQGTKLGPIGFQIFINDAVQDANYRVQKKTGVKTPMG